MARQAQHQVLVDEAVEVLGEAAGRQQDVAAYDERVEVDVGPGQQVLVGALEAVHHVRGVARLVHVAGPDGGVGHRQVVGHRPARPRVRRKSGSHTRSVSRKAR